MRWMAVGGTGSGGADGGSSVREVRCQAPTASLKISGMGVGVGARRHAARASRQERRNRDRAISDDANIGLMGKFKPVRANAKKTTRPQGAAGCVILILLIMVGVMAFLYLVMKSNANG